ncbi:MAG TPA: alpha/beta fold hydrolase [Gemmatimonadaceae bacterium]|nr:alpha/beta fold hydrolase [Gemmatimonadaceae bacterium]
MTLAPLPLAASLAATTFGLDPYRLEAQMQAAHAPLAAPADNLSVRPRRVTTAGRSRLACLTLIAMIASLPPASVPAQATGGDVLRRRAAWQASIAAPNHPDSGALVRRVDAGSPAERGGLRDGDRILSLNGTALTDADVFWPALRGIRGRDTVRARVLRVGTRGQREALDVRFVVDSVPHERIPGATVSYSAVRSTRGYLLRTVVTRPADAGTQRLPGVLFVPWLSCDVVEKPDPGNDGFAHMMRDVATRSRMVFMRVEKPGLGDSQGPDCRFAGLEDELAAYRAALQALRARPDVDRSRVFVLGGSIGGALAPILAAESPEGIAGVIAVGGFTRTWYEHMLDIERRRLTLMGRTPAEVNVAMHGIARLYTDYLLDRRTPADVVAARPELRALWDDEPRHQYGRPAAYYQDVQRLDVEGAWAALAARNVPALVVWGEYDWIMGRPEAERAAEIVNAIRPGSATLSILPRTSHGLMTFESLAATFAGRSPRYDGAPGRVIVDWLIGNRE